MSAREPEQNNYRRTSANAGIHTETAGRLLPNRLMIAACRNNEPQYMGREDYQEKEKGRNVMPEFFTAPPNSRLIVNEPLPLFL